MSSNSYLNISDKAIMNMLNHHQSYRIDIDVTRRTLIGEINDLEEMIIAAVCPGKNTDSVGGKTNKIQDPTFDSYIRLMSGRYREKILIKQKALLSLEKKEEAFDRVCTVYKKTFWFLPKEYEIVNSLFFSVKKETTWSAVAQEIGVSKSKISEARKLIFKLVRILYDSDYKTEDIDSVTEEDIYSLVELAGDDILLRHIDRY